MAATAAKVAAQVAPNIVTGGIVAEAGPPPDFSHWTVEDDILLKNSVEAGAAMEALAKGAVRFSRRFSVKELRERWRAILYDPVIAKEAAARIVQAETALTDSSRANVAHSLKDLQEVVRKRRLNSVRTRYYKMRKRIAADKLVSADQPQDLQTAGTVDQVQGLSSLCESVEVPGDKDVHHVYEVANGDLALDLEDRTFSHMFSLLAAGGVGAVVGALPAVAHMECPENTSGAAGDPQPPPGDGHPEIAAPKCVVRLSSNSNEGFLGPETSLHEALQATTAGQVGNSVVRGDKNTEGATIMEQEQDTVRCVENAEDTTNTASDLDTSGAGMTSGVGVQLSLDSSPMCFRHLSEKVEDQAFVHEQALHCEAMQVHPVLPPPETVEIPRNGQSCLSNIGNIPVQATWFESNEPLRNGIYVAGASFCCDVSKDGDLIVDKQTESSCSNVQLPGRVTEKAANHGHQPQKLLRPESEHSELSEYLDKSLWPDQLLLSKGEDPVHIAETGVNNGSGDVSSSLCDRRVDCVFDDLKLNRSQLRNVDMWVESPLACETGVIAETETLTLDDSLQLPELTVPVPSNCVLNTEDPDVPSLDGSLLSPSSSQSSFFLSQDGWESWSEGLTTDASEVSKCADRNGPQLGAGDASDTCKLNQGLPHGYLDSCIMNGAGVLGSDVGTGLCSVLARNSADLAEAQYKCGEVNTDAGVKHSQDCQARQEPEDGVVVGAQFGVMAPYSAELEATYNVGVANYVTNTCAPSLVNSQVLGAVTDWQNGNLALPKLPPQLDQLAQETKEDEDCEHAYPVAHESQELNSEDELSSDLDMARFSDVEAMVLDMDLDPGFDDEFSSRSESRRNYRRHSGTLIRLEQGASTAIQRSLTLRGAIAVLYGFQAKYFITKAEVLLGRGTQDNVVDIDLTEEGRANKVSRRQAYIKLKEDGVFYLKNLGRRGLTVNNNAVQFSQRAILGSNCLIEVGGMRFIFEINHKLVRSRASKLQTA